MIKRILCLIIIILTSCKSNKLEPKTAIEKLGPNPYFEINGESINRNELGNYDPNSIASLTTFYNEDAIRLFGNKAKDGAVIIQTKDFCINEFETLFKSFSSDFEELIKETSSSEIQYILNGKILVENFEGDLATLNDKLLKSLKVIGSDELKNKYQIDSKNFGVIIKAKRPKNVYNSNKKF